MGKMNPPSLTPEQEKLLNEADFDQLCAWYNELYPARDSNLEIKRMFEYLNKLMRDKA